MGHPALRPPGRPRPFRFAGRWPWTVGAGFIPPAEPCAAAGFPGRCEHRPLRRFAMTRRLCFPGWPRRFPLAVGADSISARRRSHRRGVPGTMRASSPTEVCYNVGMSFPGWTRAPVRFVGVGHGPPAEPCAAANRADISGLRTGPAVFGLRNAPAGAVESAPTGVAILRGLRLPGIAAHKKISHSSFSSRS